MGKNKELELAIKIAGAVENSFYESTKLTKKELQEIAKQATWTSRAAESMSLKNIFSQKNMKEIEPFFTGLENVAAKSFKAISAAAMASGAAISSGLIASVKVGSGFEEQMSTVQAISMSDDSDMARLNNMAKELGKSTKFSAAEVGQGFEYMAMAGWKTEDMLNGISGVLNLAAASGEDLGEVSDIVTDAMTAFGLGAEQAGHFADVLAIASSNSNTNVSMMGETFKYVAPVAGALGYKMEDTAVAIGLMANSGIKAGQAGTTLRAMFSRLAAPTKEVKGAMDALNLSLTDEDGKMKSFLKLTQDIRDGFAGMSEVQQSEIASKLAGQEAMSGLLAIANASDEDFKKLTEAINESTGAAEKMAEIRLDNLNGDITVLRSAAEGFGIELYENFNGPLRSLVQTGTEFIGDMANEINAKYPTARRKVMDFAESMRELQEPLFKVGGWFLDNPGAITGPVAGIGAALGGYKIASGISSIAKALTVLNPAGKVLLGLGGVVGVIMGIGTAVKKAAADAREANLAAHFGDITLSMAELQETAAFIARSPNFQQVQEAISAMGMTEELESEIRSTTEALNKMNWKVSVGMELTESEQEEYRLQIEDFIDSTRELLEQEQYALSLSVKVLFGEDSEKGNAVMDAAGDYFKKQEEELTKKWDELHELQETAWEDNILSPEESKEYSRLMNEITQIQAGLTGSEYESNLDAITRRYQGIGINSDSMLNVFSEVNAESDKQAEENEKNYKNVLSYYQGMYSGEQYDIEARDATVAHILQEARREAQALNKEIELFKGEYGEEFDPLMNNMLQLTNAETEKMFQDVMTGAAPSLYLEELGNDIVRSSEVPTVVRDSFAGFYNEMDPRYEHLLELIQQLTSYNVSIPEEIKETADMAGAFGGVAGDSEAVTNLAGLIIAAKEEYQEYGEAIIESGSYVPEEWAWAFDEGIAEYQSVVNEAARQSGNEASNEYVEECHKVFEGAEFYMPVNFLQNGISDVASKLTGHKDGGIFNTPHMAWVAEAGYPESIIPLNGSKEAMDLWLKTGELLGMDGLTGGPEPLIDDISELAYSGGGETVLQIDNSRTIYYNGSDSSREKLEAILEDENEKFARLMETYLSNNRRMRFYD